MRTSVSPADVSAFLDLAVAGRRDEGVALAVTLLDGGVPPERVVMDLLAAAQREVGERWQRAEWTVADEHVASGVIQATLEAIAGSAPGSGVDGLVLVACAEGDWHSLPAQMFSESLRASGYRVIFLGASTPARDVADAVSRHRPGALIVTCSMALHFAGVARLADAAHRHGVPVLAGGRALTAARAARLGADGWAPDLAAAREVLARWRHEPPTSPVPPHLDEAVSTLAARADELVDPAMVALTERVPQVADYDERQLARTREDLATIVRFVAAARLVDDPTVFREFERWLVAVLEARGVPPAALAAGLAVLAPLVREVDEPSFRLMTSLDPD